MHASTFGYVVAFTLRRVSKRELKSYSKPWLTTEWDKNNGIKEIVNFKAKMNQKTTKIVQDNTELTDPKVVPNAFNHYFANVGANLASLIPDVNKSPLEYLKNPLCNNFYLFPITPAEIETQVSNLNSAKAAGPFSLPANILKILKSVISVPLSTLFNTSLSSGIVPINMKVEM